MKFFTSDLHFGHEKIISYEDRPFVDVEAMTQGLIERWNNKVGKDDEVYILGDLSFYKGLMTNIILQQLNGRKYLIKGNHDSSFLKDKNFDSSLFEWVKDYATVKDNGLLVVMMHYPMAVWDRCHYGSIHLYGHVHSNKGTSHPLQHCLGGNAFNVGVDVQDFEPKTLNELMNKE